MEHFSYTLLLNENSYEDWINLKAWSGLIKLEKNQTIEKDLQELIRKDIMH